MAFPNVKVTKQGNNNIFYDLDERRVWRYKRNNHICKSKDRRHNGQKKKDKRTNNDLQNTTQKSKDQATWTPLRTGDELRCSGRVCSSCSTSDTLVADLVKITQISSDHPL
jgi:hypothetical protein